jgi:hypothetical protein
VDVLRGRNDLLGKAARAMRADDLQVGAAVAFPNSAGVAFAAPDEGLNDHQLAFANTRNTLTDSGHPTGDFMPADDGIAGIRVLALVDAMSPAPCRWRGW